MFLATGFYAGRIPFAPGTFGSAVGIIFCYAFSWFDWPATIFLLFFLIATAILISQRAESLLKQKDPGCIVIDEIAGMVVVLLGLPFTAATAFFGFLIFRTLDIIKPFPIRQVERRLSGGTGIVMDDVLAGLIGNLILRAGLYVFQ